MGEQKSSQQEKSYPMQTMAFFITKSLATTEKIFPSISKHRDNLTSNFLMFNSSLHLWTDKAFTNKEAETIK